MTEKTIPVTDAWLREFRRLLFYSARMLREEHGDAPLADRVEEEAAVIQLNLLLGDDITADKHAIFAQDVAKHGGPTA